MADITKCVNGFCTIKDRCYRFTAKDDDKRQSYSSWKPMLLAEGEVVCDGFMKNVLHCKNKQ